MSEEDIKTAYLEWIEKYCNNKFNKEGLPGGIKLALDQLVDIDPFTFNVTSEKLSDMSQTFSDNGGDIPQYIYKWIDPYKRVRSL